MCFLLPLCLLECLALVARCIQRAPHALDTYNTLAVRLPIATVAAGKFPLTGYADASIERNIGYVHVMIRLIFVLQWLHTSHPPAQRSHRTELRCYRRNPHMGVQFCHSRDIGRTYVCRRCVDIEGGAKCESHRQKLTDPAPAACVVAATLAAHVGMFRDELETLRRHQVVGNPDPLNPILAKRKQLGPGPKRESATFE